MKNIKKKGLQDILNKKVLNEKIPILGICLGMQLFSGYSEEGDVEGLGWIPGNVTRFPEKDGLKIPHIGWNSLLENKESKLFQGIANNSLYYFVHSYYFNCEKEEHILAKTHYGIDFVSAIRKDNIIGTQFHPEKSHGWGIQILKNFSDYI